MGKGAKRRVYLSDLVPVECYCDPPKQHSHHVAAERLKPGGDLWGRVRVIDLHDRHDQARQDRLIAVPGAVLSELERG